MARSPRKTCSTTSPANAASRITFTAVGYGYQRITPVMLQALRVRMFATPHLILINGGIAGNYSLLLSNNHSTGGICFGDSGGPNFIANSNVIGGVHVLRLERKRQRNGWRLPRGSRGSDDLNWLATFGVTP